MRVNTKVNGCGWRGYSKPGTVVIMAGIRCFGYEKDGMTNADGVEVNWLIPDR
jgi:hypothetical protein